MDWVSVVLRVLHIGGGILWVGGVATFVLFVQPSAGAVGPAAGPLMRELLGARKLVDKFLMFAGVTILAGLVLYVDRWIDAGSFADWVGSGYGLGLTIGMLAALVAVSFGAFGSRPLVGRLLSLQGEIAASGGPPTPEQQQTIGAIQGKLKVYGRTALSLLAVSVITMATAQYW
ncbi:MAG TPA: hypothetical protein VF235_04560 [Actinomycetota bacterium]